MKIEENSGGNNFDKPKERKGSKEVQLSDEVNDSKKASFDVLNKSKDKKDEDEPTLNEPPKEILTIEEINNQWKSIIDFVHQKNRLWVLFWRDADLWILMVIYSKSRLLVKVSLILKC